MPSADPRRRSLPVAAVVPARDAKRLGDAVAAILGAAWVPEELVVVDDGSRTPVGPLPPPGRTIRTPGLGRGPARNLGARATAAPLLWFVDADVLVGAETLGLLHAALEAGADAAMGVYSDWPLSGYQGFRRAHHRFQVLANPEPRHLSAACLLIRRSCFDDLDGFPDLPAMEDVALGVRGTRHGYRWRSVPAATVEHLPRRGALAVVVRDHRERGMAAVELTAHEGLVLEHAASPRELAAALASAALAAGLLTARLTRLSRYARPLALGAWLLADWPWLRYAARRGGVRFAATSLGWLLLFRTAVATGAVRGLLRQRERRP